MIGRNLWLVIVNMPSDQSSSTKKKRKPAANNPWRKPFFNSQRYSVYLEDEMKKGKGKFPGGKGSKKC